MKKLAVVLVLILGSLELTYSQATHDVNFILLINDELPIGTIANSRIIIKESEIEVLYHPGSLAFGEENFRKVMAAGDSMILAFDYYEYKGGKQSIFNYRLPFYKNWLDQRYLVMKVYQLDKKKYKGVFQPLDKDRNYTFELAYPGGQMLRSRGKTKK